MVGLKDIGFGHLVHPQSSIDPPGLFSGGLTALPPFAPRPQKPSLAEILSNRPSRKPKMKGLAESLVRKYEESNFIINGTVSWLGDDFTVYSRDDDWHEVAGLYIFAGLSTNHQGTPEWHPLYIGQCKSFAGYISTHRKWPEAAQLGATRVHARVEHGILARREFEAELIRAYQPPLNVQLR